MEIFDLIYLILKRRFLEKIHTKFKSLYHARNITF